MKIKNLFLLAALGLMASATLTSCEDILGEWSRPTPAAVTPSAIAVTSITLDAEATINVGETKTLTATVAPDNATDKTVSWNSEDETIAGVNASTGEVTGVAVGTTTITATANDGSGVKATCTVTVLPAGTLAGVFSVSATKKVRFSQGNLQAVIASGPTDTYNYTASSWKFAEHQWDYIGDAAGNTTFTAGSTVDLFGWVGTSANYDTYGLCIQNNSSDATFGQCYGNNTSDALKSEWGKTIDPSGTTWRTLTSAEWTYLFSTRETGGTVFSTEKARYAHAEINTDGTAVKGIILFPDGVDIASTEVATAGTVNNTSDWATKCTSAQWTALEAKGCVFLPAAGNRSGAAVSNAGSYGRYWSSSPFGSDADFACGVRFFSGSLSPALSLSRYNGYSVRLVRPAE